ncbi:hypothetical protein GGI42DRAFT_326648 [Trichoderma sp. SZMC 28013]
MSRSHAGFSSFPCLALLLPILAWHYQGVAEPFIKTASKCKPDQGLKCSLSEDVLGLYAHMPLPQVQISGFRTAASVWRAGAALMSTRGVAMHSLGGLVIEIPAGA